MSNDKIVIVFGLFLILTVALYLGSQGYSGFSLVKSSLLEYPYEGFSNYQEAFDRREGLGEDSLKTPVPVAPVSAPVAVAPVSVASASAPVAPVSVAPVSVAPVAVAPVAPSFFSSLFSKETPAKEGFESSTETIFADLQGAQYGDEKPVGFMYNNKGSATCKNYGYTNSQGFVCMNENDIKLLTTRGGNASGSSDQIGK